MYPFMVECRASRLGMVFLSWESISPMTAPRTPWGRVQGYRGTREFSTKVGDFFASSSELDREFGGLGV